MIGAIRLAATTAISRYISLHLATTASDCVNSLRLQRLKDAVDGMNVRWTFTELEAHLEANFGGHQKAEGHESVLAYIKVPCHHGVVVAI